MWVCPNCGVNVDEAVDRCWGCGGRRPAEEPAPTPVVVIEATPHTTDSETSARSPTDRWWTCAKCGTRVEPGFEVCWHCGTSIEGIEDPEFVTADKVIPDELEEEFKVIPDDLEEGTAEPEVKTLVCPKCQGAMHEGFLPDNAGGSGFSRLVPAVWVDGQPQPSFWTGTWGGKERYPLRAFRCEDCAYLEFYARD